MSSLLARLDERVLVLDGAMGTELLAAELDRERDLGGGAAGTTLLTRTRPELVSGVHRAYLEIGCDLVETNTFLGSRADLEAVGLSAETRAINREAARLARAACDAFATRDHPRFALGAIGPGTRLPTLGQTEYGVLLDSYADQARGLLDGGVDGLLVETCQDPLQIKAAVNACLAARDELGRDAPLFVSVTMEVTGRTLVGTSIDALVAQLEPYPIELLAVNCATGPREMGPHVRSLARSWPSRIGAYPNAGLPQRVGGELHYPLTPEELAQWLVRFVEEDGAQLVGGCCGAGLAHMRAVVEAIGERVPLPRETPPRTALASAFEAVELRAGTPRTVGTDPACEVAAVTRADLAESGGLVQRHRADVRRPLLLDAGDAALLREGLELSGGRSLVGTIADAETLRRAAPLARQHGAMVLLRDPSPPDLVELALGECGLRARDLVVDETPLPRGNAPRPSGDAPASYVSLDELLADLRPDIRRAVAAVALPALSERGIELVGWSEAPVDAPDALAPAVRSLVEELWFGAGPRDATLLDRIAAALAGTAAPDVPRDITYPTPPFLGARAIESIPLANVLPYVDEDALFQFLWDYRRKNKTTQEHQRFLDAEIRPLYWELARRCESEGLLTPRAAYGYWPCAPDGDALVLFDPEDRERELARFVFPRSTEGRRLCVADFFHAREGEPDVVALQVVTVGGDAFRRSRELYAAGDRDDARHLHGLAVATARALAEHVHRQIRGELGISRDDARETDQLLRHGYRGARFPFGDAPCPDLAAQATVLDLVGADRIGVRLDEELELRPAHSTAAIVCHHPNARWFAT